MDPSRFRLVNDAPVRADASWVLYWMTSARRTRSNVALELALDHARELKLPLVVLEAVSLASDHPCRRFHARIIEGMKDNAGAFAGTGILYHPYVEPTPGAGKGLLDALMKEAACVVGDLFPTGFLRTLVPRVLARSKVRSVLADGNGLLPLDLETKLHRRAVDYRRHLQKTLREQLALRPQSDPLAKKAPPPLSALPDPIRRRWPAADLEAPVETLLPESLAGPEIIDEKGGAHAARQRLESFVKNRLPRYVDDGNHPDEAVTSRLSPDLHFGHLAAWEAFDTCARRDGWDEEDVDAAARGGREGWWGLSPESEAFLDQLVTWRELGFAFCHKVDDHADYDSLPEWALASLEAHVADSRQVVALEDLEEARSPDPLWNAAQRQLRDEGRIPNYLRMIWGKRVLEWTSHPRIAWDHLFLLNDRYALDGRDPNSVSGISWCFGRFDRAWGPERPVFGKVRYMSSDNTRKKLRLKQWLSEHSG